MIITDAQLHIWHADTPERPWPAGTKGQKPYEIRRETMLFQMDLAGVQRAILVPPSWDGERNDKALEAAQDYPERFAVMGRMPIADPTGVEQFPAWRDQQGMLGLRFAFHRDTGYKLLTDGTSDWIWRAAEKAGLPLMLFLPNAIEEADRIALDHPNLKIIIDHAGLDHNKGPEALANIPAVCNLARHPNVAVKASGIPSVSSRPYPFTDLHDPLQQLFDTFGPKRMFWGTDLTRMPCTYYECIHLFTDELSWLSGEDLEWVMGKGISEWLDWPL